MFLNDLNNTRTHNAVSPLNHDVAGRFSRKGKLIERKQWDVRLIDSILIALFITFLMASDFILFTGSGNIDIFQSSIFPITEVSITLGGFILFSLILMFILYKYTLIKTLIAAIFSFGFVYVIFQQFSQLERMFFLGDTPVSSAIIIGSICAAITFVIFIAGNTLCKALFVVVAFVSFGQIYTAYMQRNIEHEFIESYNNQTVSEDNSKRFIYLMFPNLVSYSYLSTFSGDEVAKTKEIISGFYQKNKFKVYSNSYLPEDSYLDNMVSNFNPNSQIAPEKHLLKTRKLFEYWRFHNLRNEYIYLKNNELFDYFNEQKYQLSAYKSRDFDMCHKDHEFNVSRCIEKINRPTNIYDTNLALSSKIDILLAEWLSSMKIFKDMSSAYNMLSKFVDAYKIPMVGINYNNLYVVNSINTFDILLNNIKDDTGKQAYFVFIDIPSDMYIYDEFCQIKTRDEWLNMVNLPWVTTDLGDKRKTSYLQQSRCLFGKLNNFIENMKKDGLLKDSVIVMQGVSSVNGFNNYLSESFIENFMNNRLVSMAILDNSMSKSSVDTKLCSTNRILTDYLFHTNKCGQKANLDVHEKIYDALYNKLNRIKFDMRKENISKFDRWYTEWLEHNKEESENRETLVKRDVLINEKEKTIETEVAPQQEVSPQQKESKIDEDLFEISDEVVDFDIDDFNVNSDTSATKEVEKVEKKETKAKHKKHSKKHTNNQN